MPEPERVADALAPEPAAGLVVVPDEAPEPDVALAVSFAEVARDLSEEPSTQDTLDRLVHYAVPMVQGCEHAGVTVARPGWFRTSAATDEVVHAVDRCQYDTGEGPCVDALREREVFRTGDLGSDPRWPAFGSMAADLGVHSMLSYRLFSDDDTFGSLNLYSREYDAFPDSSIDVGAVFAAHAALALARARDRDSARNLELALESNRAVSTAIGILMATQRVDEAGAFVLLRDTSQRINRKLRAVAEEVVRTGSLPELTATAGGATIPRESKEA